jgi:hypothetical protein
MCVTNVTTPAVPRTQYSSTAIATDGTLVTKTSLDSAAAALAAANATVTAFDRSHPLAVHVAPVARMVRMGTRFIAVRVTTAHAPLNRHGSVLTTLMGPINTSIARCKSLPVAAFARNHREVRRTAITGSASQRVSVSTPHVVGCYALSETVVYVGGARVTTGGATHSTTVYVTR